MNTLFYRGNITERDKVIELLNIEQEGYRDILEGSELSGSYYNVPNDTWDIIAVVGNEVFIIGGIIGGIDPVLYKGAKDIIYNQFASGGYGRVCKSKEGLTKYELKRVEGKWVGGKVWSV